MKNILVLGSGFGGTHTYRRLFEIFKDVSDVSVSIISQNDYFWFTPMAHEVATGSLSLGSITYSLRNLPKAKNFNFIHGVVSSIHLDLKKVEYVSCISKEKLTIRFDYLVNAIGSETDFLGVPGAEEYAISLKTRDDVLRLKKSVLSAFDESRGMSPQEMKKKLSFVVVGGGPTGVELVGELCDLISTELSKVFPEESSHASITLFHSRNRLIHEEDECIGEEARKNLEKNNVRLILSTKVIRVEEDKVFYVGGSCNAGKVFWTSGVRARRISMVAEKNIDRNKKDGRVCVESTLSLVNYPNVFVIGDQAWCEDKETGQPYPMRAQFAVRQGILTASNIQRSMEGGKLEEFHWKDKGFILSLGRGFALARVFSFRFSGPVAWWVYRSVYIPQILGFRSKIRVLFEWTLNLFLPRDLSDL